MICLKVKGFYFIIFLLFGILLSYGCSCPPTQEIADAEVALSSAREAGAQIYATEEYKSAESMLDDARGELEKYHYLSAKSLAIESQDKAVKAKELSESEKIRLRNEARDTLKAAKDALIAAEITGAEVYDLKSHGEAYALIGEAEMALSSEKFHIAIEKAQRARQKARRLELATRRALESELEPELEVKEEEKKEKKLFLPVPEKGRQIQEYFIHTVQKGECLWIISAYKEVFGNPFMWPLIYRANRSQIEDPDLIFPGQNLEIIIDNTKKDIEDAMYKAKNRGHWSLYDKR